MAGVHSARKFRRTSAIGKLHCGGLRERELGVDQASQSGV
jgi:hypothetical protein